jgi:hypothetical protein
MQTINDKSVWTMRKYAVRRVFGRDRELYKEMLEKEINPFAINVTKNGKGNTPCMSKVLGGNRDDEIEFNTCDKVDR